MTERSKKRRKKQHKQHPEVKKWTELSDLASNIAQATQNQVQYAALLMQISDLTRHEETAPPGKKWSGNNLDENEMTAFLSTWLEQLDRTLAVSLETRDNALLELRKVDVADDENLKNMAAGLTDAESKLKKLTASKTKWSRIVRFEASCGKTLAEHTTIYVKRWLGQWTLSNEIMGRHKLHFLELLKVVSLRLPNSEPQIRNPAEDT